MVSAEDLSDGIGQVGAVAYQTGLQIEELNGYITSMAAVTGKSGSELGVAMKSILSRLYRIGTEGASDQGKSEALLNSLGVAVRGANAEFRSANEILEDLSKKWDSLTRIQKANVGQTLAGV
jgi:TP901 family phage tail tape measure protein